ncbi:hypothetical protein PYH37_000076 [Sinorhizobium numidicum]|uniref:Uncharacterized protein n=1 Tax=Sinorhizobium numidicum TaxID=680248 RepID=A0ABY8CTJ9_9HYPH|nr:hypothetical protein [Sinorhizobium numidicum]WEX74799.1 hypothetical protein PYH37_000076 [Sinorhizobium numidicum]WEX80792.1 hypothetical protein PYH38_000078 [Sinorhizobium numidicum]
MNLAAKPPIVEASGEQDQPAKRSRKVKGQPADAAKQAKASKWTIAREMLLREGGVSKEELFAALKWRSMSLPLLKEKTRLEVIEKTEADWKAKA